MKKLLYILVLISAVSCTKSADQSPAKKSSNQIVLVRVKATEKSGEVKYTTISKH